MSLSSHHHLYNRLAHPADYSIFSWEWTCLPVGESMLAQEYSVSHTDSVLALLWLAYGQRG